MESKTQTQTLGHGSLTVAEQRYTPKLRPKPSSSKLRSTATQSTVIASSNLLRPSAFNRSRTDLSVPRTSNPNNAPLVMDSSVFNRRAADRRPPGLPTPVERLTTPVQRLRTGPPTKDHRVFISGTLNKVPSSVGSSGPSSDKSEAEKKRRRLVKKKTSATSSDKSYALGNSSSGSLSTTASSHFGSRNTSQSSVLGITPPATSASSQSSLHARQRSGSIPQLLTQDLPVPLGSSGVACDNSSPSTRYTDSPFSHSSTPSSASSHSPGPAAALRAVSSSPSRPPVTRQRTGSFASVECNDGVGLDPVRESTTSTSSDSTVRATERTRSRSNSKTSTNQLSPPLEAAPKPSKLAPSPHLVPSSKVTFPVTGVARPRWGGNTSGIPPRPTKEGAGLGLSLPGTTASGGNGLSLAKTRSRSISTTLSQGKLHKDRATPPLPSPGLALPTVQRAIPSAVAQGLTYNTIPPLRGAGSQDSVVAPRQATPAITKPGFFSRGRTKSEGKVPEKLTKRGPAAGTGYEGYGAFGKASRSRSGGAGVGRERSGSQTSTTSTSRERSGSRSGSRSSAEVDDYLAERLKPVVIAGGEVVENHNRPTEMVRSGSSPAVLEARSYSRQGRVPQRSGSSLGVFSRGGSPPGPVEPDTVAARRFNVSGRSVTPIPAPITTSGFRIRQAASPAGSVDSARKMSLESQDLIAPASSKPKTKRWIFFPKSQPKTAVAPSQQAMASPPAVTPVPLVSHSTSRRKVPAHYALLDHEEQREAQEMVERMQELRRKRVASNETPKATANHTHVLRKQPPINNTKQKSTQAAPTGKPAGQTLLPPYRSFLERSRSSKAEGKKPENDPAPATSELRIRTEMPLSSLEEQVFSAPASMGRVGAQAFEAHTIPSPEEFQINWKAYGLTPTNAPSGAEKNKDFWEYDPLDSRGRRAALPTPLEVDTPVSATSVAWPPRNDSISSAVVTQTIEVPAQEEEETHEEFYSELEGMYGIPPTPAAATFAPAIQRTNTVRSTTSSLGSPFQYADLCSPLQFKFDSPEVEQREEQQHEEEEEDNFEYDNYSPDSPTLPPAMRARTVPDNIPILSHSDSTVLGPCPDQPLPFTPTSQGILPPSTPFSISPFIRYYGETDEQREGAMSMADIVKHQLDSPAATPSKTHRATDSNGSTATTRSSSSTVVVEDEMKLRPWALIASRWLSFDRVLVSPAHQALSSGNGGRVLVVDGLGTDDWSFYCALSYPSAKVYNLSQASPFPPPTGSASPVSPSVPRPSNHHQVHYPSFATPFPFPKGFFNVICFRFLPSSSDAHWAFILSQCKRVLRPGGHLEVTLLDADLMSVGPRTQRAVDLVKAIMQRESEAAGSTAAPRPASEKVLRILAKKGFEDINKCFVGLPAVGKVGSSGGGGGGGERDFTEREHSPEDPDDINEVVSKVGRWWYSRCYEGVITAQGEHMERSMWADRALLRECRKRHTNFRMLVCCARKPIKGEARE